MQKGDDGPALKRALWVGAASISRPEGWFALACGGVVSVQVAPRKGGLTTLRLGGGEDAAVLYPAGWSCFCSAAGPATRESVTRDAIEVVGIVARGGHVVVEFEDAQLAVDVCYYAGRALLPQAAADKAGVEYSEKVACIEAAGRIVRGGKWREPKKSATLRVDNSLFAPLELHALARVAFPSPDAMHMHEGWHSVELEGSEVMTFVVLCPCPNAESNTWVVVFHGNGESVTNYCFGSYLLKMLHDAGCHVCFAEYRGYHPILAPTGQQTCGNVGSDVATIVAAVRKLTKPERLLCYGRSIGSLAVIAGTCSSHCDALIIESGFSTSGLLSRVQRVVPHFDGELLPLTERLAAFPGPVMLIHARDDHIVRVQNYEENVAARAGKSDDAFCLFEVGMHSVLTWSAAAVLAMFRVFLAKVNPR
jgi:hypothetical protein